MTDVTDTTDKSNLFVWNYSWDRSEEDLRALFAPYGELEEVKLIVDKFSGRSKWFGFVKFVNEEDAIKAREELNEKEVDERPIRIDFARPRVPREERPSSIYSEEY